MRLNRRHVIGALYLLILTSQTMAAQEEQWLQYRYDREADQITDATSGAHLTLKTEKPEGVKLPKFECEPLFGQWQTPMAEAGFLHVALDRSTVNGPYNLLYLDRNVNGHLNDEEPLIPYRTDSRSATWGPVKLVFEGEDGPIVYHVNLRGDFRQEYRYLRVTAGGWYEGSVDIKGKSFPCILLDFNGNGVFDDQSIDSYRADRIRIGSREKQSLQMVGRYLEVNETLYALDVARDGAFIVLDLAEDVTYGQVKLPSTIISFGVGGPQGQFTKAPQDGIVKLPVGKYRIEQWTMERKQGGTTWRMKGSRFREKGDFEVRANQPVDLKIGEPLTSKVNVRKEATSYYFTQTVVGQLGESIDITQGGNRPPQAPKLHIRSTEGKYERTYSFSYG